VLHVWNASISDTSLLQFADLVKLKELWLMGTDVTEKGVEELRKMIPDVSVDGPSTTQNESPM